MEKISPEELIANNPQLLADLYPDQFRRTTISELSSFSNGLRTGDRSALQAGGDFIVEGVNAVLGSGQAVTDFLFDPNNMASNFIGSTRDWLDENISSDQRNFEKALLGYNLAKADSFGQEAAAVGNYIQRNPDLAIAQGIGSVAIPVGGIKIAQGGLGLLSRAGVNVPKSLSLGRVPFTNKKIQVDTGLVLGGSSLGFMMAQGDAAGTAYETVQNLPLAKLEQSAAYQDLIAKGNTEEQAREILAQEAADTIGYIPGVIGAVSGIVGLERFFALDRQGLLFKPGTSYIKNTVGQAAVEGLFEGIEEGATAYYGQKPVTEIDPTFDPTKGVGGAAAFGVALGGITGGGFRL